jgi:hypothetical protein
MGFPIFTGFYHPEKDPPVISRGNGQSSSSWFSHIFPAKPPCFTWLVVWKF